MLLSVRGVRGGGEEELFTSVHYSARVHVFQSAAQLHKIFPYSPLWNESPLLLEVLSGEEEGLLEQTKLQRLTVRGHVQWVYKKFNFGERVQDKGLLLSDRDRISV